jgi:hypothetical protein
MDVADEGKNLFRWRLDRHRALNLEGVWLRRGKEEKAARNHQQREDDNGDALQY